MGTFDMKRRAQGTWGLLAAEANDITGMKLGLRHNDFLGNLGAGMRGGGFSGMLGYMKSYFGFGVDLRRGSVSDINRYLGTVSGGAEEMQRLLATTGAKGSWATGAGPRAPMTLESIQKMSAGEWNEFRRGAGKEFWKGWKGLRGVGGRRALTWAPAGGAGILAAGALYGPQNMMITGGLWGAGTLLGGTLGRALGPGLGAQAMARGMGAWEAGGIPRASVMAGRRWGGRIGLGLGGGFAVGRRLYDWLS